MRWLARLAGAGLLLWGARLFSHSKVPPPEGRWREVTEEELM